MSAIDGSTTNALWERVLDRLRDSVATPDYFAWFTTARAMELDGTRLEVEFANDYAVRIVREKFLSRLQKAADDVLGSPVALGLVSRETADTPQSHSHTDSVTVEELRAESTRPFQLSAGTDIAPDNSSPMQEIRDRIAADRSDADTPLNPRYRFDTFVIGEANQLAHAAALSVAEAPGSAYNPLFIHGGTGLGKTHLLHAIGQYIAQTRPELVVAYVPSESFVNRFHQMIQMRTGEARERFKTYFRGVDVLLMDDVQLLEGKGSSTQEELFHTFNALHERGAQIVLTSDREPSAIQRLEDRITTRFGWGLITDIEVPDRETRVAILAKKAQADRVQIPMEVLEEIAERVSTNVRELEGALTRVIAASSLSGRPLTRELAEQALVSFVARSAASTTTVTIERIQQVVCEHFQLTRDDLVGPRRTKELVRPRWIGMYLAREMLNATCTQVGHRFGGRDHSTVLNAYKKVETLIRNDGEVYDLVEHLTETIRSAKTERVLVSR